MPDQGCVLVVGGTAAIGLAVAQRYADQGREVVITGRDQQRTEQVAEKIGSNTRALALDLAQPEALRGKLAGLGPVDRLVLSAIERDENRVRDYDIAAALRLVTLKLVGYTEVVHALCDRFGPTSSIVLFGGLAKDRPYPGSTTVSTVNGGVTGLVHSLASELAPLRVNALHPGIVGDTPNWVGKPPEVLEAIRARTPLGHLITTDDIVDAVVFLLENPAVNGTDLVVDGGWLVR
jgi:NAD(P)-dependent dehydrogenase (short-subunit alcohol dehydrogenase family)